MSKSNLVLAFLFIYFWATLGSEGQVDDLFDPKSYAGLYALEDIANDLTFLQPIAIESPRHSRSELFVAERHGKIFRIPDLDNPTKEIFLDLTSSTSKIHIEAGLLGLAFHPNYKENKRIFVFRTQISFTPSGEYKFQCVLSEFDGSENLTLQERNQSEKRIIAQVDPDSIHNGGTLQFGHDGYLYFSVGENGPKFSDLGTNAQKLDGGFFRGIFRIDVDNKESNLDPNPHDAVVGDYKIPIDNPFVGKSFIDGFDMKPEEIRTETWAYGMRNTWKFRFHPEKNFIVAGDVGSNRAEELNIIHQGGMNFGWPYYEGDQLAYYYWNRTAESEYTPPIYSYQHGYESDSGNSIIAGLFYQGSQFENLKGKFIFGDFYSGNIWSIHLEPNSNISPQDEVEHLERMEFISSFGKDPRDNEILVVSFYNGKIYKLIKNPYYNESINLPQKLSDTGIFKDLSNQLPSEKFIHYDPNVPFWSDGLIKKRWVTVPEGQHISFNDDGSSETPTGTLFIKHFDWVEKLEDGSKESYPIETRLLLKTDSGIIGSSYEWDSDKQDATLVERKGKSVTVKRNFLKEEKQMQWLSPSQSGCNICHNSTKNFILGFTKEQLNDKPLIRSDEMDQLTKLFEQKIFTNIPDVSNEDLVCVPLDDERFSLTHRFKSYTHSNCSSCHIPDGKSREKWDARLSTPMAFSDLINIQATPAVKFENGTLINPDTPNHSEFLARIDNRGLNQMPPIATYKVDSPFLEFSKRYIHSILSGDWRQTSNARIQLNQGIEIDGDEWIYYSTSAKNPNDQNTFIWAEYSKNVPHVIKFTIPSDPNISEGTKIRIGKRWSRANSGFSGYEFQYPDSLNVIDRGKIQISYNNIDLPGEEAALIVTENEMLIHSSPLPVKVPKLNIPQNEINIFTVLGFLKSSTEKNTRIALGKVIAHPIEFFDNAQDKIIDHHNPYITRLSNFNNLISIKGFGFMDSNIGSDSTENSHITKHLFLPEGSIENLSAQIGFIDSNETFSIPLNTLTITGPEKAEGTIEALNQSQSELIFQSPLYRNLLADENNEANQTIIFNINSGSRVNDYVISESHQNQQEMDWFFFSTENPNSVQVFEVTTENELTNEVAVKIQIIRQTTNEILAEEQTIISDSNPNIFRVLANTAIRIRVTSTLDNKVKISHLGFLKANEASSEESSFKFVKTISSGGFDSEIFYLHPGDNHLNAKVNLNFYPLNQSNTFVTTSQSGIFVKELSTHSDKVLITSTENPSLLPQTIIVPKDQELPDQIETTKKPALIYFHEGDHYILGIYGTPNNVHFLEKSHNALEWNTHHIEKLNDQGLSKPIYIHLPQAQDTAVFFRVRSGED